MTDLIIRNMPGLTANILEMIKGQGYCVTWSSWNDDGMFEKDLTLVDVLIVGDEDFAVCEDEQENPIAISVENDPGQIIIEC